MARTVQTEDPFYDREMEYVSLNYELSLHLPACERQNETTCKTPDVPESAGTDREGDLHEDSAAYTSVAEPMLLLNPCCC